MKGLFRLRKNCRWTKCNIYIRLWDADDNEIGFGEFVGKEEVTTYTRFEINAKCPMKRLNLRR